MKFINQPPPWEFVGLLDSETDPLETKIASFKDLKTGWHFGEGIPPSGDVMDLAINIFRIGRGRFLKANAFPSIEGGIVVAFYAPDDQCLEVSISSNKEITLSHEIGHGFDYSVAFEKEKASLDDIKAQCKKLSTMKTPNLSESSIHGYLIRAEEDSPATVSKTLPAIEGYQWWMQNVSEPFTIHRYAST